MDDGSFAPIPEPGDNAFDKGPLDKDWMRSVVKRVNRQILVKTAPGLPDGSAQQSEENIVIDLSKIFGTGLRITAVANGFPTDLIFMAFVAPPLPAP